MECTRVFLMTIWLIGAALSAPTRENIEESTQTFVTVEIPTAAPSGWQLWEFPTANDSFELSGKSEQIKTSTVDHPIWNPAESYPTMAPPNAGDSLESIKNNFVGGMEAIKNSLIGFIALIIGGAKEAIDTQIGKVYTVVEKVGNQSVLIKDNLAAAGGAIVNTWGDSIRQTGNITSQLVHSFSNDKHVTK